MKKLILFVLCILCPLAMMQCMPSHDPFNAAKSGDRLSVERFLEDHGDPNAVDFFKRCILYYAVCFGSLQIVKLLVEAGAKIDVICPGVGDDGEGISLLDVADKQAASVAARVDQCAEDESAASNAIAVYAYLVEIMERELNAMEV